MKESSCSLLPKTNNKRYYYVDDYILRKPNADINKLVGYQENIEAFFNSLFLSFLLLKKSIQKSFVSVLSHFQKTGLRTVYFRKYFDGSIVSMI